MVDHSLLILTY